MITDQTTAEVDRYRDILAAIARGRTDNGRPLAGARAQTMARAILAEWGRDWPVADQEAWSGCRVRGRKRRR